MQKEMQLYVTTMQQGYFNDTQEVMFRLDDKGYMFIEIGGNHLKFSVDDFRKIIAASDSIKEDL